MPRNLHIGLNKESVNMRTDDIGGAQPQCVKFTTNRCGHNPLNPTYKLQTVQYITPEPTRFMRDQMHIDDIDGARPVKKKQIDIATRDLMNCRDIPGTTALPRHHVRGDAAQKVYNYNPMDYRDVTNVDFKSKRTTNPLDPTYIIRDEDSKVVNIGLIPGNKPVVLPPPRKDENFQKTSLQTHDIHGCATSTKGLGSFHTRERRGWRDTNTTADISGAQPDTLKKSPDTIRCTNPLMPDYQMPGRFDCVNPSDAFSKRK